MTPPGTITFYFDFVSPYAYLGWSSIQAVADAHGRTLLPVPVLFAAILDAHGQKGPAEIPAKRDYTRRDVIRKAHRAGLRVMSPPTHPFNPLLALRVASLPMEADARRAIVDALFAATWRDGLGVDSEEKVSTIVTRAGFDGPKLVALASEPDAKNAVRKATAHAIALGVFGVPTVIVDDETFWGTDGLAFVDAFLRGDDPVPRGPLPEIPSSAARSPKPTS